MEKEQKSRLRNYAWNYFEYHAAQRMKTFHFYLILVLAFLAGLYGVVTKDETTNYKFVSLIPLFITIISVLFSYLDKRNRELVRNGESALCFLDNLEELESTGKTPHVLKIFEHDNAVTNSKPAFPIVQRHISYTIVLRLVFWIFGLSGFVAFIVLQTL